MAEEPGPLSERRKRLVQVLEIVRVDDRLPGLSAGGRGRPQQCRVALAQASESIADYDFLIYCHR